MSPKRVYVHQIPHLTIPGARRIAAVAYCMAVVGCGALKSGSDRASLAEESTQQGRYQEAIALYQEHIAQRLDSTNRPEWENPHFYLLRIGDLYLRLEQPDAALASYTLAEQNAIEPSLISDRYRAVASWHIERDNLSAAFELLKKYRDRDSLLFDAMLDRVGKELTAQEASRPAHK